MATLKLTPFGFRSALPSGLPDLIVQSVTATPASPVAGDHVVFSAVVKNQGTGPTPTGAGIGLLFSIDGNPANWATDTSGPLAAGGTRTITATAGSSGGNYWVALNGTHDLLANVNDTLTIPESNTNNNTFDSSLSVTAGSGGGTTTAAYGPTGAETPRTPTPAYTGSFDVIATPSTLQTIVAGLTAAQANSNNYRVGLAAGTYSGEMFPLNTALDGCTSNVLIAAVTPGTVTFTSTQHVACSHITVGYITWTSGWYFAGANGSWLWRSRGPQGASYITGTTGGRAGGSDCGWCGCVSEDEFFYTNNATSDNQYDRIHVGGNASGKSLHNVYFDYCWIAGATAPAGNTGHSDAEQIDGLTGVADHVHTFFGPAARNGNVQAKADVYSYSADPVFCTVSDTDCFRNGAHILGQGNASNQSGPHRATRVVYCDVDHNMAFRFNTPLVSTGGNSTTPDCQLTDCTFYGTINGSGSGLTVTNPTFMPSDSATRAAALPARVKAPWEWW